MTKYKEAKDQLKQISKNLKRDYGADRPAIRMGINDACDGICKDYYYRLTDYQQNLLHEFACKLHP